MKITEYQNRMQLQNIIPSPFSFLDFEFGS